jgi:hypothetical protein
MRYPHTGAPLRMAFLYFPNGAIPSRWNPKGSGKDFEFSETMAALENLKHRVQVISGLERLNANAGNDGAGDHARANGTFLTGVRVKKTAGSDIYAGVSVDQIAAHKITKSTRFASLELSCDAQRKSGSCDSGYSCAYEANLAWRSAPETDATRVSSLLLAHDGSNRAFPEINVSEGHHSLSHHRDEKDLIEKVALIDRFYAERFAEFLTLLESKKHSDGHSVLHNSMIVYGCGNSDGNRHTHANLPIILAGNGVGVIIAPGGGHKLLCTAHEGSNVAEWLAARGISAFVLKYRLANEPGSTYSVDDHAVADLQRAIRLIRSRADERNIDAGKLGVMGFSAGGEVCALCWIPSRFCIRSGPNR